MGKHTWGILDKNTKKLERKAILKPTEQIEKFIIPQKENVQNIKIRYTVYYEGEKMLKLCRCEICDIEFGYNRKRLCNLCNKNTLVVS